MNYDPNINYGVHTVRATLMQWDYVGHIAFQIDGNCKGATLLDPDFIINTDEDDINRYVENDCNFAIDGQLFSALLTNDKGHELEIQGYEDEISDMIVKMENVP